MYGNGNKRPKENPIFQQQLRAWKPLMSFKDASLYFLMSGLIIICLGVFIYFSDLNVHLTKLDYTDCKSNDGQDISCSSRTNLNDSGCFCVVTFKINDPIPAPVYFYYGLTNYYQNHRLVMNSYDMHQLMGQLTPLNDNCWPLIQDNQKRNYAPCGQLANVIFNDQYILKWNNDTDKVPWTNKGIALNSDLLRYGKPTTWVSTVKPPMWLNPINITYANGYKDDQDLMVWMRPAPIPDFRKLHHILNNNNGLYQYGLPSGDYALNITYRYPVKIFGGRKWFIIQNTSWMGGKNFCIGLVYLITGILQVFISIVFIPLHVKQSRIAKKIFAPISIEL